VIGEEASLDEVSRPELAVIRRFALATSLRIEESVTLSWPQVDGENREVRLMRMGQHDRTILLTAETRRSSARSKAPHKMAVFMFVARPGVQQGRRGHPRRRDWLELGGVGFRDPRRTPPSAWTGRERGTEEAGPRQRQDDQHTCARTPSRRSCARMEARAAYMAETREKAVTRRARPERKKDGSEDMSQFTHRHDEPALTACTSCGSRFESIRGRQKISRKLLADRALFLQRLAGRFHR
jgi:integrase